MAVRDYQWDIFCSVIDNFGDIGICWRLSRQLAKEQQLSVRLWVDDLSSFKKICPAVDTACFQQQIAGVDIYQWQPQQDWQSIPVADVVIEALACTIPVAYRQRMAEQAEKPLWLNLEYLSAESWVEDCHTMASVLPPLTKYFFFPGFTAKTGGLLQERELLAARDHFLADNALQQLFWQQLGIEQPEQYQQKISLFAYDHPQLLSLLQLWQQEPQQILCLVPEGALANQLKSLLPQLQQQNQVVIGQLTIQIMPFLSQQDYDRLLWACDINFVRGEDSIIRAHWAAKPFIWQIYRQDEDAHLVKLQAFLQRYTEAMPAMMAEKVNDFFMRWNTSQNLGAEWKDFAANLPQLTEYNQFWATKLSAYGDLASNLVRFVEKKIIMTRNFF